MGLISLGEYLLLNSDEVHFEKGVHHFMDHNAEEALKAAYDQYLREYTLTDITTALESNIPLEQVQRTYCFAINPTTTYLLQPTILFEEKLVMGMNIALDPIETLFQAVYLFDTKTGQPKPSFLPRIRKYFEDRPAGIPYIFEFVDGFIMINHAHSPKKKGETQAPRFIAEPVARPIIYDFFET